MRGCENVRIHGAGWARGSLHGAKKDFSGKYPLCGDLAEEVFLMGLSCRVPTDGNRDIPVPARGHLATGRPKSQFAIPATFQACRLYLVPRGGPRFVAAACKARSRFAPAASRIPGPDEAGPSRTAAGLGGTCFVTAARKTCACNVPAEALGPGPDKAGPSREMSENRRSMHRTISTATAMTFQEATP